MSMSMSSGDVFDEVPAVIPPPSPVRHDHLTPFAAAAAVAPEEVIPTFTETGAADDKTVPDPS